MKNRNARKYNYQQLKRKIFFRTAFIIVTAIGTPLLLLSLFSNKIGSTIIDLLQSIFPLQSDTAQEIYRLYIRNNSEYILIASMIILFVIPFILLVRWITSYFDEINAGIDILIDDKDTEIILSPEMNFMENKLTTLKQTLEDRQRSALQAEQKKNDLVMYLAHDIRTPLTSVIGYLSLLDEAPDMPIEQKAKYVAITLSKAHHLELLINEFFEITRFNSQTIILQKEHIDLYYMLVQMVDEAYPQLSSHGQSVQISAPEDMLVYCDADKLARVLNNILKNAIAYGKENTDIELTAHIANDKVFIAFRNVGTIPKEKLLTIFEKFYRLDDSRSTGVGGSGLGLAIAKEIITLHGGTITAESDNLYTTFIIKLPVR